MSHEMRKKYEAQEQERMEKKEKLFEHIKYNMNQNRPSIFSRRDYADLYIVWDVQWDKLKDDKIEYPAVRTNIPPPRKREGKDKPGDAQPAS